MKRSTKITLSILFFSLFNLLVFLVISPFITKYLINNNAYPFFDSFIKTVYPRFIVESQRLPISFFIGKFEQIILRIDLITFTFIAVSLLLQTKTNLSYISERFTAITQIGKKQKKVFITIFYIACLYYTYDWYFDLLKLTNVADFYKPVGLLKLFVPSFPTTIYIHIICITYYMLLIANIFSKQKTSSSIGVSLLFLLQLGLLQSFEKTDHTYATFTYGILLMPFLCSNKQNMPEMAIAGIRLSIGFAYFFSASEKLLTGGNAWLSGKTLKLHLLQSNNYFEYLETNDWLLHSASLFVISFQLLFIFSIVSGKGKIIFTLAGILFHWSTYFLLNVGGLDTPWIFMYVFLIDTETIKLDKKVNL